MPPHADQHLEERILKAAQNLWKVRGEHGLTLRAVAKLAGTTTPTVYKRFRNREVLLGALGMRVREQINEDLFLSKNIEEAHCRYLGWAENHPHEYQLMIRSWSAIFHPELPRPGRAWYMMQLANRFGGNPEDYAEAFTAMYLLTHGAASLITTSDDEAAKEEVRSKFLFAADALLKNIEILKP